MVRLLGACLRENLKALVIVVRIWSMVRKQLLTISSTSHAAVHSASNVSPVRPGVVLSTFFVVRIVHAHFPPEYFPHNELPLYTKFATSAFKFGC